MVQKIAIIVVNGSEDIETLAPLDVWRRWADFPVELVSASGSLEIITRSNVKITCDLQIEEVTSLADYRAVLVPGGQIDEGMSSERLDPFVDLLKTAVLREDFTLIALCAAPGFLWKWGLLEPTPNNPNPQVTSYPGVQTGKFEDIYVDDQVVVSGNLITGNGPGASLPLAYKVVEVLADKKTADAIASDMQYA